MDRKSRAEPSAVPVVVYTVSAGVTIGLTVAMIKLVHRGRWQQLQEQATAMLLVQLLALVVLMACSFETMLTRVLGAREL
jgi:NADH:ubiquinone oxidoreductase subunit 6 (subunit J)